jgi:exodeoxyribonuclease-3
LVLAKVYIFCFEIIIMKLMSWNVNGIRSCLKKGFLESVEKYNPDVLCLQEIKAHFDQVDINLNQYEHRYWNSAEKKGYSGTAVFSKIKPLSVKYGFGVLDEEGRVITLEFDEFFLVSVYVPNSKPDLSRLDMREKEWGEGFLKYVKNLPKPVIFCGDLNVAHEEIDIKNAAGNKTTANKPGSAGFTDTERRVMTKMIEMGYVDSFRYLHPKEVKYSYWSYMFNARKNNVGWRLDYFMVDEKLKDKIKKADILTEVHGSDHAPVWLEV